MSVAVNRQWADQIRSQAAALDADEEHLHNNLLHKAILSTWQRESPRMWTRLERAKLTEPLAKVLQARMWERKAVLVDGGMPMTDAREMAEREILMLEPEETAGDRIPAEQAASPLPL